MNEKEKLQLVIELYPCPPCSGKVINVSLINEVVYTNFDNYVYHNCDDSTHVNVWFKRLCAIVGINRSKYILYHYDK